MNPFRAIDITGRELVTPASQPAPQLMWVEIDQLVIDDRYQRPMASSNWVAIRAIASRFMWSRFSPVLVAPIEGGRYAVIDGQHRAHAAALCGFERIPAMVALVAPEEQALAFIDINTQQIKVQPNTVYRAALTAGEDWAVRCRDAVEAGGCRLMMSNFSQRDKKPGMVFCVDLIRRLIEQGQDRAVTRGLSAMMAFAPDSVPNFSNAMLKPWLTAVAETGAHGDALLAALHARRPWQVLEVADRLAESERKPKAEMRRMAFVSMIRQAQECAA